MIERVLLSAEASSLRRHVVAWHRLPADAGASRPFPPDLDDAIAAALRADGIQALYVHQALAFAAATAGRDVVVVTPTASGKSLCYNLPVLQTLRRDPSACALYLFPAKALARDQAATLTALATAAGVDAPVWAYDGDTPTSARAQARRSARILLTNPDMLHVSLLPHHRLWTRFLAGLRFVVVDELHVYRGVFGSHVANVFRRLLRVCRHYGADPRFVACSATIANPGELASALCGRAVECVSENGAPRGERHFLVYNPPLVDRRRGLRRNPLGEARRWAALFLRHRVPTVVFSRSRLSVEVLAARLTEDAARFGLPPGAVAAYRGGYLPDERRSIERGLREGRVQLVVSTNALELGVDIGQLQACVLHGYPGAVASTWQQAGRAGRRGDTSATVLVAGPGALDQYIARNPSFLLGASPEAAYIHADNPRILASHARCAAFELPFRPGERFGALAAVAAAPAHGGPDNSGVGRKAGASRNAGPGPAASVNLRRAGPATVTVFDTTEGLRPLGAVDGGSAPLLLHPGAVYLHGGRTYRVEHLDATGSRAYVRRVRAEYFTDAHLAAELTVTAVRAVAAGPAGCSWGHGDAHVAAAVTTYRKVHLRTLERLGWGRVSQPAVTLDTAVCWLSVPSALLASGAAAALGTLSALAHALAAVAPLHLLCEGRDLRREVRLRDPNTRRPTVFLYEAACGGIGLAERLFHARQAVAADAARLLDTCACTDGCPACTGPVETVGPGARERALALLHLLIRTDGRS